MGVGNSDVLLESGSVGVWISVADRGICERLSFYIHDAVVEAAV